MIRMTEQGIRDLVTSRVVENELIGLKGLDFVCARSSGKWVLTFVIDGSTSIRMRSQREDDRTFASIDSAYKVASSIVNSMTVIGK